MESRFYSTVSEVKELARGGECVVYTVDNAELDEIVAKCTLFDNIFDASGMNSSYDATMYESQTLKLLRN